jgi:uncharacterized protein (DUF305 family)
MLVWRPQAYILSVALVSLVLGALLGRALSATAVAGRAPRVAATAPAPAGRASMVRAPARTAADQALAQAMTAMDTAMRRVPLTGKPDVDFATMMIPHHAGAVAMAQVELLYGTDPRLRRLAQEIIVTQESEIAVMRYALTRPYTPPSPAPH